MGKRQEDPERGEEWAESRRPAKECGYKGILQQKFQERNTLKNRLNETDPDTGT